MEKRIEEWSVGELARVAGVTVRMLHHYDEIGLLRPGWVGANGYRYYGRAEAERLQEILLLRALGVSLGEIAGMLDGPGRLARLRAHRARLETEAGRLAAMIETLDRTIDAERKGQTMAIEDLYMPSGAEQQEGYEAWLIDTYGADMAAAIARSRDRMAAEKVDLDEAMTRLRAIEGALVLAYEQGTAPEDAHLADHRDWVADMWGRACSPDAHAALADTYLAHPDFVARYEALSPGFSQWFPAAMKAQGT